MANDESSEKRISEILNDCAQLLGVQKEFGMGLMKYVAENYSLETSKIPHLMYLRRASELLDAISVLVAASIVEPTDALIRALLELSLQIHYMLESDVDRRGLSYMYFDLLKNIKWHEMLIPETANGKNFQSKLEKDSILEVSTFTKPEGIETQLDALNKQRLLPDFSEIHKEFERAKQKGNKLRHWYSIFDGPQNLEQLANQINRPAIYELLYRHLSEYVHGASIVRGKIIAQDGKGYILDIRSPESAPTITSYATSIWFETVRKIVGFICPEKENELSDFYTNKIRATYLKVSGGIKIKVVYNH